jgi:hypothetical protein
VSHPIIISDGVDGGCPAQSCLPASRGADPFKSSWRQHGKGRHTKDNDRDRRLARHRSEPREALLSRGHSVVASSRHVTQSAALDASDKLALVDGNIGEAETAAKIAQAAKSTLGSIDALVNNAGIYF